MMLIELMVSAVVCAFVIVVGRGLLDLPSATVPKFSETGEKVTGLTPVPFTRIFCGLLDALSEIVTVPDFVPSTVGENVTVILHFAPAAIEVPQVFTWLNGGLATMLIFVSATFWLLVRVTAGAVVLAPRVTFPKFRVVGDTVTGWTPVPLTPIDWGLLLASSATVRVEEREPKAEGENLTLIEQLAPAPRVDPQVLV